MAAVANSAHPRDPAQAVHHLPKDRIDSVSKGARSSRIALQSTAATTPSTSMPRNPGSTESSADEETSIVQNASGQDVDYQSTQRKEPRAARPNTASVRTLAHVPQPGGTGLDEDAHQSWQAKLLSKTDFPRMAKDIPRLCVNWHCHHPTVEKPNHNPRMAPQSPVDIPAFATTQLALLDQELQSELQETSSLISNTSPTSLQRAGLAITNLVLNSQRTGLGGKTVVELGPDAATSSDGELSEHGIRTGDIVVVAEQPAGSARKREVRELEAKGSRGVVTRVGRQAIWVALDGDDDDNVAGMKRVWVVKLANDVTYKRMNQTMERLKKMKSDGYSSFVMVLFGLSSFSQVPNDLNNLGDGGGKIEWIDPSLNDSQKDAILFALASREVALIHGPPGTGKTHTLIELILQMLKKGLRVLVCGPSNISVDNIVERLAPHRIPIVRLGHPARLLPSVLNHSLDVLTQTSEAAAIVKDVRKEMDAKQASIRKTKSGRERKAIYTDLKELRKEFRERERKCVSTLIRESKVVLATLHGAGGFQLRDEKFDVVIVDEASQALEAQCWVPLLSAQKVVLAGDHLQLPPTIKSLNSKTKPKTKPEGIIKGMTLETTLFDRLLALHGPGIKKMLTTQYRMHERIMRFPSDELYESKLLAAEGVKGRLLKDLPYEVKETEDTTEPLIFFDTQGGDFPEKDEEEDVDKRAGKGMMGESKSNEMEAILAKRHVRNLVDAGVHPEDIAIVTPYNAQLALMARSMKEAFPGIELGSVDGFQGREKEAIIVSLVRSNTKHEVGFLGEKRRLNVAMTRPKRSLTIIGDSETVASGSRFLQKWMGFLEENSDLRYPSLASLNAQ
ncbi:Nucleoside-triphosphate phosphatase [Chlorociboria aeruginascens]|nr:Nucleoside-triphosphate phosphatase [Chlorociboria aeruginascens]